MNSTMTVDEFVDAVRSSDTIFGVSFIKKTDGSVRNMTARMSVKKGVKGVISPEQRKAEDRFHNVLTVYDMNVFDKLGERGAFRRINLDQLLSCTIRGQRFVFDRNTGLLTLTED